MNTPYQAPPRFASNTVSMRWFTPSIRWSSRGREGESRVKVSKMDRKIIRAIASMEGCTYGKLVDLVVDDRMVFISALGVCAAGIGATMVWESDEEGT